MGAGRFILYSALVFGGGIYVGRTHGQEISDFVETVQEDYQESQLKNKMDRRFESLHQDFVSLQQETCRLIRNDESLQRKLNETYKRICEPYFREELPKADTGKYEK